MSEETTTQRLATHLLGQPVAEYIATCRRDGLTWRKIADELADLTDNQVRVSHETLRQWAEQETAA